MSLATRCPACHTVFRVVQDQLRVSEGWVRCGQCQEVFNALETLFDIGPLGVAEGGSTHAPAAPGTEPAATAQAEGSADEPMSLDELAAAPVAEAAPRPTAEAVEEATLTESHTDDDIVSEPIEALAAPDTDIDTDLDEPADIVFAPPAPSTSSPPSAPSDLHDDTDDDADAPTPSRFIGPVPDWARQPARERRSKKSKSKATLAASEAHAQAHQSRGAQRRRRKPEFVRQAERAAMWRRPAMRALLGGSALLLAAVFVLQVAHQYREPLAAQVPALAPGLRTACAWLGCRIGPPRAIDRIRLDASDLTRTEEEQVLRLTAEVHNTADYAVRTPALDVSFTDALGRTVSRKVMTPAELGARGEAIDADGHWRVDARLAVGELRIAGYTVEVFYP